MRIRYILHVPSGSHMRSPSSSNRPNLLGSVATATINPVDASKVTFEYVRERGTYLDGILVPILMSGIHSSKQGP